MPRFGQMEKSSKGTPDSWNGPDKCLEEGNSRARIKVYVHSRNRTMNNLWPRHKVQGEEWQEIKPERQAKVMTWTALYLMLRKPNLYLFGNGELLKDFRQSSNLDRFHEQDAYFLSIQCLVHGRCSMYVS